MKSVARLLFACAILTTQSFAAPLMLSNGMDGAFAPDGSIRLTPDADGVFNFTTIDIPEPVLVSFDRSSWDRDIYLLATGDISILGALDTGPGQLHLYTPGTVTLGGKVYGDTLFFRGEEFHYINNPNGRPDMHHYGGVSISIQPDGELDSSLGSVISGIDAGTLTAGVEVTAYQFEALPLAPSIHQEGFLTGGHMLPTPLPPAIWLLLSALAVTGFLGRGGNRRAR
ncbi:MAG TPA: hypothetical protein ENI99_13075 [Sedimenticola sp.]|nr:hypothetical protein [Sedimenticola sp.]